MKRDDWKAGMENEAASVEDAVWARETLVAAQQKNVTKDILLSSLAAFFYSILYWISTATMIE